MTLTILADENIPLAEEFFGSLGPLERVSGRSVTAAQVAKADVLLVRSVTRVDATLLDHSSVGFVGTCTIGTDHLDLDCLSEREIAWANAPGCNANSVVEYVYAALAELDVDWREATVGIIGCGNVGGLLYRKLRAQGVECRCYDPFLSLQGADNPDLSTLEAALSSSIVSLHTPLTRSGIFPTWHLLGERELQQLQPDAVLLNCGRGPVIDNAALLTFLQRRPDVRVVLDVWEQEPHLARPLLERVALGTPHIAGYSYDGKVRGTEMIYQALCQHLRIPVSRSLAELLPPAEDNQLGARSADAWPLVRMLINQAYPIATDDQQLRNLARRADLGQDDFALGFDHLRKHYPERREFHNYHVSLPMSRESDASDKKASLTQWLTTLGFRIA